MIYLYHACHLSNTTHTNVSGSPFQEKKKIVPFDYACLSFGRQRRAQTKLVFYEGADIFMYARIDVNVTANTHRPRTCACVTTLDTRTVTPVFAESKRAQP